MDENNPGISGTTCAYTDTYETESVRGLTTRFQVVKGQFMNRVTGVKESTGLLFSMT